MNDPLAELMLPHEQVLASLGCQGPPQANGRATWSQVALTQGRVLVAVLAQDHTGNWAVANRWSMDRSQVRMGQYPRTPTSVARLEIYGFPAPIVFLDIDHPQVHDTAQHLVATWGQPVMGIGEVMLKKPDEGPNEGQNTDSKTLIWVMALGIGIMVACCGCGSLLAVLRNLLANPWWH